MRYKIFISSVQSEFAIERQGQLISERYCIVRYRTQTNQFPYILMAWVTAQ